jgi:hypothetical protein
MGSWFVNDGDTISSNLVGDALTEIQNGCRWYWKAKAKLHNESHSLG